MERVNAQEARAKLAELTRRAGYGGERFILCYRGRDVAAIVPVEDLEALERLEDEVDLREAEAALAAIESGGETPLTLEELDRTLGLDAPTPRPARRRATRPRPTV
jgi:prevent-host-death family protein